MPSALLLGPNDRLSGATGPGADASQATGIQSAPAAVAFTGRDDGDFGPGAGPGGPGSDLEARQRAVVDRTWKTVRQVHGRRAVVVGATTVLQGVEADALVTASPEVALAVKTADCASVAFASADGIIAVAHAGWRGLVEGILAETVAAMRGLGATDIVAGLGPCIGPECYEFAAPDLDAVAARLGDGIRAATSAGRPALDLRAAVRGGLEALGVALLFDAAECTACGGDRWFSHRARGEAQRQAAVVWRTDGGASA